MNTPTTLADPQASAYRSPLLDAIVEGHGMVGDGLRDQDLTCLLHVPDPGNLGELGWASGALGEEWTQMFEQPLKPTAGLAGNESHSP